MKKNLKLALDKAKISHELIIELNDAFNEDDFEELYKGLKDDNKIELHIIILNANNKTLSLENFAFITFAILQSPTCNHLRLQNFDLNESLMGNLYTLIFKKDFRVSFENVQVVEEIDGLATFLHEIKHISHCDLYTIFPSLKKDEPAKHAAEFDLNSLINKDLTSLNVYHKTPKKQLASLPAIVENSNFMELNIFDIEFSASNFYQILEAIKNNTNLRALRLIKIEIEGIELSDCDEMDDFAPGKNCLEMLKEIVQDHPNLEVFAIDYPFCLVDEMIVDFWEVIANKKSFIEVALPYWEEADCRESITKVVKNSSRLKNLNILNFKFCDHRKKYMEAFELTELNDAQEKEFGGYNQAQTEELKNLILALHAHPTITFINEEFLENTVIVDICKSIKVNLHEDLERNRIIQGLSHGNRFAKVNDVKRLRTEYKLTTEFFAHEEWEQRNVPPLRELCINRVQAIVDNDPNQVELVKQLPENLVNQFNFKK